MPEFVIDERFLMQRHADAPDHTADDLAGRGLGVQDAPGRDRTDDTGDADNTKLLVHLPARAAVAASPAVAATKGDRL